LSAPRITSDDLRKLLSKPGYAIPTAFKPAFKGSTGGQAHDSGEGGNLESGGGYESLREEAVQVGYSGKCVVRIKFYRKRLADYSRANCEKYIIDSLTYAGLIRDDSEKEIRLEDEGQVKVDTEAEERVELTLEYPEVDYNNIWEKKTKFGNATK
jgi:hypothetical protein